MVNKALGEYIKKAREAKGFSLRALALRVDKTPATISQIENGLFQPSEELIQDIAKQLGESEDVLLGLTGRMSKELQEIAAKRPQLFADFIRQAKDAPDHAILKVTRVVRDGKW
jgi:HTH-type transcriptional regulator, competence development regulator